MRPAAAVIAVFCLLAAPAPAPAQKAGGEGAPLQSPVLIIDQDRLFAESQLGADALGRIEDEARALAEERPGLAAEEFTARATAFDDKVQRLRAEQDAKARELARAREEVRADFLGEIGGVLSDIARERGAVVMLDRRQVFLSVDAIDVTDEAIERINRAVGEAGSPD